ncbi:MAG: electron transfer flavoprotein subunit alpha/FixB family protein [Actinobacteria bacterium]|nr:electron transfer flavoprotein subunit alpha/FixB family protein [Actinomycetota bacterium]
MLVVVEHDRGSLAAATLEAMAAARRVAADLATDVSALTLGAAADAVASVLAEHGADTVHQVHHDLLADYGPEAWGEAVAQAVRALQPAAVVACGTDRGNEVMAQAAARLGAALVVNCNTIEVSAAGDATAQWTITRSRWGGSLLERCTLVAPVKLLTVTHHVFEASTSPGAGSVLPLPVELEAWLARTVVAERVERAAGVTLSTAPLVVGGGRGVGSAEGFASLEELAGVLGGVVGCSRAVTNNGWRNHTDQVGQTGTRIAPDLYMACGISGAIQHWVGAMASKQILAINTDPEANMVTKADYAVIGDLHAVVPAITNEIRRRRAQA